MENLPTPKELLQEIPLTLSEQDFVIKSRAEILSQLMGQDPRTLLIVGPCSLHDSEAVIDYAIKLQKLAEEVEDSFLIVMRAYFEKPRTSLGWKGMIHDPDLNGSNNISRGLRKTRKLLKELTSLGMPLACEFLDPAMTLYLGDTISWGCVGARTTSSQIHRQMASNLEFPIAFKNTTEGNIDVAIHAIDVAKQAHTYIGLNDEGKLSLIHSRGNKDSHLVLRGGAKGPNFYPENIQEALLETAYLLVDCSHGNSSKIPEAQITAFENVLQQIMAGEKRIRGLMLESFIEKGNQSLSEPLKYGVSLTDACLDFETTQHLIRKYAALLQPCAIC